MTTKTADTSDWKNRCKTIFAEDIIIYVENAKEST